MGSSANDTKTFIPYGRHQLDKDDIVAVVDVLRNGPLTQGPKIKEFEDAVAQYVGARYAVAVSNGTAALHLACLAAGLHSGDALLTSPITFVASANGALYTGSSVQLADIDSLALNIDPKALSETLAFQKNVKVVIPVHFAGAPCDMPAIQKITQNSSSRIIEDAAHAFGGNYLEGGKIGNCRYSDMTIFSFHPVKMIACGEGGMITTNDKMLYKQLLLLRTHGITKEASVFQNPTNAFTDGQPNPWYYEMQTLGFNYRLTDIQAALGLSQLNKIETFLSRRRQIARSYDKAFLGWKNVRLVQQNTRDQSAHHLYVLRIDFASLGRSRAEVMKRLQMEGIGTQVHYIPLHWQPYYQKKFGFIKGAFPQAERYYAEALSLPIYPGLSDEEQTRVVTALGEALS